MEHMAGKFSLEMLLFKGTILGKHIKSDCIFFPSKQDFKLIEITRKGKGNKTELFSTWLRYLDKP